MHTHTLSAKAKNREHAKNTRIRKKHYIEALKESLKLLFDEREKIDKDRRNSLSRLAEQVTWRCTIQTTLKPQLSDVESSHHTAVVNSDAHAKLSSSSWKHSSLTTLLEKAEEVWLRQALLNQSYLINLFTPRQMSENKYFKPCSTTEHQLRPV